MISVNLKKSSSTISGIRISKKSRQKCNKPISEDLIEFQDNQNLSQNSIVPNRKQEEKTLTI